MKFLTYDLETHLIAPGMPAPRMVCLSAQWSELDGPEGDPLLLDRKQGLRFLRCQLEDPEVIIVGHNIYYDLGVACAEDPAVFVPLVFKAFEAYRIRDTIVRQQLLDIATGNLKYRWDEAEGEYVKTGYHLADLVLRMLGRVLPKGEDTWRLRYAQLDNVPIREWPEDARKYAIDDSITTSEVFWKQAVASIDDPEQQAVGGVVPTEERNTREAWALWLMSAWGVRTEAEAVALLKAELEEEQEIAHEKLAKTGIFKTKRDGSLSKDMKVIYAKVAAGYEKAGRDMPVTDSGRPGTDHETLENCPCPDCGGLTASGCAKCNKKYPEIDPELPIGKDPELQILAGAAKGAKLLNTYVPVLEQGTKYAINARFNVLVESNRTSASKPNMQNPPRKGKVRNAFVARPGWVWCSADYDTIELRSLAQTCLDMLGHSQMAEALIAGEDLHLNLAAEFMGISKEEAKKRYDAGDKEMIDQRQLMKPANFGFPGGMASDSFVDYAAGMGVKVDRGLAKRIHEQWKKVWSEMGPYFDRVANLTKGGEGAIISPRSGFVRGGMRFTQAANHFFQSLTATGAKDALWAVTRECYTVPSSPLWGCRPVVFMHDEILCEMPEDRAAEAAERQAELMISTMKKWIPDIPIKAAPVLMRRWFKGAKPVKINGKLVPSKPVDIDGKEKWVADLPEQRLEKSA